MSDTAIPGETVAANACGRRDENGDYCGKPVAYLIRFAGWPSHYRAGACVEHAPDARELDIERIWSVTA